MTPKSKHKTFAHVAFRPPEEEPAPPPRPQGAPPTSLPIKAPEPFHRHADLFRFILLSGAIFGILLLVNLYTRTQTFIADQKDIVLNAYGDLEGGLRFLKKQDFKKADFLFHSSHEALEGIKKNVSLFTRASRQTPWSGSTLDAASELIGIGQTIAKTGQQATQFLQESRHIPEVFLAQYKKRGERAPVKITTLLHQSANEFEAIQTSVKEIENRLQEVSQATLPAALQKKVDQGKQVIHLFSQMAEDIQNSRAALFKLLGDPLPHRYLILLQNQDEIRATGGFIGSYIVADVDSGLLKKLEFKDVYSSDGQLDTRLPPPPGLDKITDHYAMRDANYSPDFPTSAEKIKWFLEHSRGPSVDTVIALDQKVIEDLLAVTGSIPLGYAGLHVDASNFSTTLSYLIESKLVSARQPKQILAEFIPRFIDSLLNKKHYEALVRTLQEAILTRHLQAYSPDSEIEQLFTALHLDGRFIPPQKDADFLSLVSTSMGGNKSDRYIKSNIQHQSSIGLKGDLMDQLTLAREHTWSNADRQKIEAIWKKLGSGALNYDTLLDLLGRGVNRNFMRLYVPKGSTFIEAHGIDLKTLRISEDLNHTVFAFEQFPLAAGQKDEATLRYQLPFQMDVKKGGPYRFIIQKQAGVENQSLQHILQWEGSLVATNHYPEPTTQSKNRVVHQAALDHSQFFITVLTSSLSSRAQ